MKVEVTIDEAVVSLELRERVRRVTDEEADSVLKATAMAFVKDSSRPWWWESLVSDKAVASYHAEGKGFQLIPEVCPDVVSWFVVTDDRSEDWDVYEAKPSDIALILGECHTFEYFITSKNARWIVFENHHDVIIGMGDEVVGPIRNLSK